MASFQVSILVFVWLAYAETAPTLPAGGFCYYGRNAGLYAELVQFIPRAMVFIAVTFFYARLYVFLRRPDKIRTNFSPTPRHGYSNSDSQPVEPAGRRGSGEKAKLMIRDHLAHFSFGQGDAQSSPAPQQLSQAAEQGGTASGHGTHSDPLPGPQTGRRDRQRTNTSDTLRNGLDTRPPWEKLDLPMYQSPSHLAKNPLNDFVFSWDDWKGSRPVSPAASGHQTPLQVVIDPSHTRGGSTCDIEISSAPSSAYMEARVESRRPSAIASAQVPSPVLESDEWHKQLQDDGPSPMTSPRGTSPAQFFHDYTMAAGQRRYSAKSAPLARDFAVEEASIRHTLAGGEQSATASDVSSARPRSEITQATSAFGSDARRGSGPDPSSDRKGSVAFVDPEKDLVSRERGQDDLAPDAPQVEEDIDLDFASALRDLGGMADEAGRQTRSNSEKTELVPESTASYLNRKTSLLMLYFPLAWVDSLGP